MGFFLSSKNEALDMFIPFCKIVQNEKGYSIFNIRSDHGKEFENLGFDAFCGENGISHNFFAPRTPQQNEVVLEPWKKWLEQCFVKTTYQNIFRRKPLTIHAISLIEL